MSRSRFPGVLVMGVLFVVAVVWWRGCPDSSSPSQSGSSGPANETRQRGGEVVASSRSEPRSFNRLVAGDQTSDTVSMLTQGPLVRINRSTFELEPWLAERWESSADGLTHTLHLRQGLTWSDGTPLTSADVLFSLRAVYDPTVKSILASNLTVGGQPIAATTPDDSTVVLTYAAPSGPGLRLLDMLPILPRHKLEGALSSGTLGQAWGTATNPGDIVGTGPFLLREYQPGQRMVFDRNPRYWRKAPDGGPLPYIDRLVIEMVPDQNAELLRLQSGATDLTHGELRSDDYIPLRRAEQDGKVTMIELGVGPDPDGFWFCLKPEKKARDPRFAFLSKREFRQAISHAVETLLSTRRTPISECFSREAWRLLEANFVRAMQVPEDLGARGALLLAAHLAGLAIEYAALGPAHACAQPLVENYKMPQGVAAALVLAPALEWLEDGLGWAPRLRELAGAGDLPRSLGDASVPEQVLPRLAEEAAAQWSGRFSSRHFDAEAALEIYRSAY